MMIVNQHISVHRFFDLAILCGDTTGHCVMCRAVVADGLCVSRINEIRGELG